MPAQRPALEQLPYPGQETENSSAITTPFTVPGYIIFKSWHIDGGGERGASPWDRKNIRLSVNGGATWITLVDCFAETNKQPFCSHRDYRTDIDWDFIQLNTTYKGQTGILRFEYNSVDALIDFERGWFIDDLATM